MDFVYRNHEGIENFAASGNEFFFFARLRDPEYTFYDDTLVVIANLDKDDSTPYDVFWGLDYEVEYDEAAEYIDEEGSADWWLDPSGEGNPWTLRGAFDEYDDAGVLLHSYFSIERVIGVDDPAHDSGGDLIAINYDVDYTMVYGLKVFEEAESITRVFAYDNNTFTFAESESGALSIL